MLVPIIQPGGHLQVANVLPRLFQQRHRAKNSAQIPHILVFKVTAITEPKNHHLESIFSRQQMLG